MFAYDVRFVVAFRRELLRHRSPMFPSPAWHEALLIADLEEPCMSKPLAIGDVARDSRADRKCGHERPTPQAGGKRFCQQINFACDVFEKARGFAPCKLDSVTRRFWERRYGA
jgi:hypothetical protein